ncbi:MAG TPA: hypothetical protein VEM93_09575 [Actinomycetota bacterium]|nr:hypothetical protein [Actinomycetota bacterium]
MDSGWRVTPAAPIGIQAGRLLRAVAFGGGSVWAAAEIDEHILRIDPDAGRVSRTIPVEGRPRDVAVGEGAVWVATESSVVRIDPATNRATTVHEFADDPIMPGIAVGAGSVWAIGPANTLVRIDPRSGGEIATMELRGEARVVAFGEGALWAATFGSNVFRIDPATNRVAGTVAAPLGPAGIAVGSGAVWVVGESSNEVVRIAPDTVEVVVRIPVGKFPGPIDATDDGVWIGFQGRPSIARIAPASGEVSKTVRLHDGVSVGLIPFAIAIGCDAVWVSVAGGRILEVDPRTGHIGP